MSMLVLLKSSTQDLRLCVMRRLLFPFYSPGYLPGGVTITPYKVQMTLAATGSDSQSNFFLLFLDIVILSK